VCQLELEALLKAKPSERYRLTLEDLCHDRDDMAQDEEKVAPRASELVVELGSWAQ
ncbi:unnamed protein product, partial [Cladocopium goreaui]